MLTAEIVKAYGQTGSLEKTASRCGIAANTVRAILTRHPEDFAAAKKGLAAKMLVVADAATEIAGERLGECSGPQAAVVAGIMAQRANKLTAGPAMVLNIQIVREVMDTVSAIRAELIRRGVDPDKLLAERAARVNDSN